MKVVNKFVMCVAVILEVYVGRTVAFQLFRRTTNRGKYDQVKNQGIEELVTSISARLDAAELARAPEIAFSAMPLDSTLLAGESLTLRCEVAGIPPPVIQWTFNGKVIDQGPHETDDNTIEKLMNVGMTTIQSSVTISKLHLPCADPSLSGMYACVADNGHKQIQAKAVVSVKGKSAKCGGTDAHMKRQSSTEEELIETAEMLAKNDQPEEYVLPSPPTIFMWTDGRFEVVGAYVQLFCRARGYPTPRIQWYNEHGERLQTGDVFELLPNGDLLIKETRDEERISGLYTCVATNEHGSDSVQPFFYATEPEE